MKPIRLFISISIILVIILFLSGCKVTNAAIQNKDTIKKESLSQNDGSGNAQEEPVENTGAVPAYLELYEGLHITGAAIDVDIENYRLEISGAVKNPLKLSFDEVKKMPSERIYSELHCPGFFTDKGYWTGVRVLDLLNMAVLKDNAKGVKFICIDGNYSKTLALEEIKPEGFLIAYQFEDKEFSKYHGYPLRLVADGLEGNAWVKWLGKIEVLDYM